MLHLPDTLRSAIERALATSRPDRWIRDAQALSERYRGPRDAGKPLASGDRAALAYAALLLPATFAQLQGALAATTARIPQWAPTTLLDIGSGPGTALWAAVEHWPSLRVLTAWERESAFLSLGRTLAQSSANPAVREARWEQRELTAWVTRGRRDSGNSGASHGFDLVIIGHVLNELDVETRSRVLLAAWELTRGVLIIIEPGTNETFEVVRNARDLLLGEGAQTIAPCAHDNPCPLRNDWCHFSQRLKRPEFQRRARGAPSEWEDAKYSYAAMARFAPEQPIWGRVIREITSNKAYAEVVVSSKDGIERIQVLKRHREAYRNAKEIPWGAALDQPPDTQ